MGAGGDWRHHREAKCIMHPHICIIASSLQQNQTGNGLHGRNSSINTMLSTSAYSPAFSRLLSNLQTKTKTRLQMPCITRPLHQVLPSTTEPPLPIPSHASKTPESTACPSPLQPSQLSQPPMIRLEGSPYRLRECELQGKGWYLVLQRAGTA